jgi:hypothetical protein
MNLVYKNLRDIYCSLPSFLLKYHSLILSKN